MRERHAATTLQSRRFLLLYALAAAGGSAAYAPLLTLFLPLRVTSVWGEAGITVLSYAAFTGAVAASLANILFGWLSDRTGTRRPWIVGGLVLSCALLMMLFRIDSLPLFLAAIAAWQVALNMMLAPLMAWAGDCIPDEQKGTLGGLLSIAPATGALVGTLLTVPGLAGPDSRLVLNAVLVAAMILPVILFGRPRAMPHLHGPSVADSNRGPIVAEDPAYPAERAPVARMWMVRLLVQIAEAALFAFLLLYFRTLDQGVTDNRVAQLFTVVLFTCVPLALFVGRWSDTARRPRLPLTITSGGAAIGLVILALARDPAIGVAGYVLFGIMAGVFLSLHSSQTLRVLPRPGTRGRDLGIFNLTNTVPSLIMPWLVLALIPMFGFQALFALLACFAAFACLLLLTVRKF